MELQPQILVIADDDLAYGIKKGYYPKILEATRNGQLSVISIEDYKNKPVNTKTPPLFNGKDFFLRNPYTGCYISMDDSDILNSLIDTRSIVIKESLVRMGAKSITLVEETSDTNNTHTHFSGNGNFKLAHANIDSDYEKGISVNIKSKIGYNDPNNKPRDYKSVEDYILSHGLGNEGSVIAWLERYKEDGILKGAENLEVTFFSEIQSALKITASIDYKLFSTDLDFSKENNHVHTITKTLSVNFG